jgi:biopolymer transport protein ExbD
VSTKPKTRYLYSIALFNVFLVLLVFVVLLPYISGASGLSVFLPKAISSEPVMEGEWSVTILADQTIYLNERRVSLQELERFVAARSRGAQVLIKSDKNAAVGTLVRVWDLFRKSGFSKVYIATNE